MSEDSIPLDKLVKVYRKIKAEIDTLTKEYDTKLDAYYAEVADRKAEAGAPKCKLGEWSCPHHACLSDNCQKEFVLQHTKCFGKGYK